LRGGLLPQAYVYPKAMRATRDLLRRRSFLVRRRAELLTHLVNTNSQYNLPALNKKLVYPSNRGELNLPERFTEPSAKMRVQSDLNLMVIRRPRALPLFRRAWLGPLLRQLKLRFFPAEAGRMFSPPRLPQPWVTTAQLGAQLPGPGLAHRVPIALPR
jgi:hypothetical protein